MLPEVIIRLPDWVDGFCANAPGLVPRLEDRMRFVIELARQNVLRGTGGPFAAGIFDANGGLVAPGVNMVIASNCSVLHAEIVALVLAQKAVNRFDLSDGGRQAFELVSASEPCAMCHGAVHWSGLRKLACGARREDVQAIGFDEGPKLADWEAALKGRGVEVFRDVLRHEAAQVLKEYAVNGGIIYNSGR